VASITPEMVERRHHEITTIGGTWKELLPEVVF
jgi:hypothetical protein